MRANAYKADVRLDWKLRYDFAKLRAKGQLQAIFCSHYVLAVPIDASSHRASAVEPPSAPITREKREGPQVDPDHGAQNHPRHMSNLAEGISRTS